MLVQGMRDQVGQRWAWSYHVNNPWTTEDPMLEQGSSEFNQMKPISYNFV